MKASLPKDTLPVLNPDVSQVQSPHPLGYRGNWDVFLFLSEATLSEMRPQFFHIDVLHCSTMADT